MATSMSRLVRCGETTFQEKHCNTQSELVCAWPLRRKILRAIADAPESRGREPFVDYLEGPSRKRFGVGDR
jgi:hypothetical protein